jgi:hypothetical protein
MSDNRGAEVAVETGAISLAAADWCAEVNRIGAGIWWGETAGPPQQLVSTAPHVLFPSSPSVVRV